MKENYFDLKAMKKKGKSSADKYITAFVGVLVFILLAVNIAPTMFSSIADFEPVYNESSGECIENCNTPEWISAVFYVIVGAGIVYMAWRMISKNTK